MERLPQAASVKLLVLLVAVTPFFVGCATHSAKIHEPEVTEVQHDAILQQEDQKRFNLDEDEFDLEAEFEPAEEEQIIDPLGGYNRLMTQFNDKFYFWLLKPVSQGYRVVVPEGARLGVGRFFRNLLMPARFVNNLLQLKPKRAGIELARFVINSTLGLFGFFDPADNSFELQSYPEDFGQTLGYYGVGAGFHIVLPLLGPSNLRDSVGLIPDYFLAPTRYIDNVNVELALYGYKQVNQTSLHIGEYESLKKDAIDFYTFLRDGYEQRRVNLVKE